MGIGAAHCMYQFYQSYHSPFGEKSEGSWSAESYWFSSQASNCAVSRRIFFTYFFCIHTISCFCVYQPSAFNTLTGSKISIGIADYHPVYIVPRGSVFRMLYLLVYDDGTDDQCYRAGKLQYH